MFVSQKARLLNFRVLLLRLISYRQRQLLPDPTCRPRPIDQPFPIQPYAKRTRSNGWTSILIFRVSISKGEHIVSHVPLMSTASPSSVFPELMSPCASNACLSLARASSNYSSVHAYFELDIPPYSACLELIY